MKEIVALESKTGRPREFAPGIFLIGACNVGGILPSGTPTHTHASVYLVRGTKETVLVDTGTPRYWPILEAQLASLLGDRPVDWLVPTHPEVPHAGLLHRLMRKYPKAKVWGDVSDYHLFWPEYEDRLAPAPRGSELDLGGGYRFVLLEAIIKDLPSTIWGYEASQQVLFVADAFAYSHHPPLNVGGEDYAAHFEGECALMTGELSIRPSVEQALFITRAALYWTRYVEIQPFLERFFALLKRYPTRFIAPAHGNVISNLDDVMPIIWEAHRLAYESGKQ